MLENLYTALKTLTLTLAVSLPVENICEMCTTSGQNQDYQYFTIFYYTETLHFSLMCNTALLPTSLICCLVFFISQFSLSVILATSSETTPITWLEDSQSRNSCFSNYFAVASTDLFPAAFPRRTTDKRTSLTHLSFTNLTHKIPSSTPSLSADTSNPYTHMFSVHMLVPLLSSEIKLLYLFHYFFTHIAQLPIFLSNATAHLRLTIVYLFWLATLKVLASERTFSRPPPFFLHVLKVVASGVTSTLLSF
jgi:hypothetical protein